MGMLFILLAGSATLLWQLQSRQQSRAAMLDAGNVIGSPSLPAATVDSIFARMGSPMVGTGKVVEQEARATNIDDAFALGVWWTETNDGEAGVGLADRNPGSVRGSYGYPSAYDGYTIYPSYAAAIIDWFNVLKSRYVSRGLTSVYSICYPYVGTSSSLQWAYKVVNLMIRYRGEAPPPTPAPIVTPTVNPTLRMHKQMGTQVIIAQKHVQAQQGQQQESARPVSTHTITAPPTSEAALPRGTELALMALGLLTALAIALLSLLLRRGTSQEPEQASIPFASTFNARTTEALVSPLFVKQYSPVREHQEYREHETEQLPFPNEVDAFSAFSAGYHADSYYGQRNTEALPRRITLRPLPVSEEERHTSMLGHEEHTAQAVPVPVVNPTSRGLLARYNNTAEDTSW